MSSVPRLSVSPISRLTISFTHSTLLSHLSICSLHRLPQFPFNARLSLCSFFPSLSPFFFPHTLPPYSSPPFFFAIYLSFHLSQPPPALSPSLSPFLYTSSGSAESLLSSTCPDIPRLGSQTGNWADRMTKGDRRGEKKDGQPGSYCSKTDRQAGVKAKDFTGRERSKEAALGDPDE